MAKTRKPLIGVATGGVAASVSTAARRLRTKIAQRGAPGRWLGVTVLKPVTEVEDAEALAPLRALPGVELVVREAPGGRGSEVAARWQPAESQGRSADELRRLLREAKQVLEVGEVLIATPRPAGARPSTVGGRLIDAAERRAGGKGVL
jgi:hypothetical protein